MVCKKAMENDSAARMGWKQGILQSALLHEIYGGLLIAIFFGSLISLPRVLETFGCTNSL